MEEKFQSAQGSRHTAHGFRCQFSAICLLTPESACGGTPETHGLGGQQPLTHSSFEQLAQLRQGSRVEHIVFFQPATPGLTDAQ